MIRIDQLWLCTAPMDMRAGTDTTLAYHLNLTFGDDPNTAGNAYQAVLVYTATTP